MRGGVIVCNNHTTTTTTTTGDNNNNNNKNNNEPAANEPVANEPAANTASIFSAGTVVRTFPSSGKRLHDDAVTAAATATEPPFTLPLHPKSKKLCEKWGVVTTTLHPPTNAIRTFAALKDWCLVIVANDTQTPTEGYLELTNNNNDDTDEEGRIVFLSLQDQTDMANHSPFVKRMIPSDQQSSFVAARRKNIGYLFAIRHGAQAIFDFNDD